MGVGKTSVGKALSTLQKRPFFDLDKVIEMQCSSSIQKIFNDEGEAFFREKETEALADIVQDYGNGIIALGGGTLIKDENRSVIRTNGTLIYLEASPESILKRIMNDSTQRPLLEKYKTESELLHFIHSHLKERLKAYQKADMAINTDSKSIDRIVEELSRFINNKKKPL